MFVKTKGSPLPQANGDRFSAQHQDAIAEAYLDSPEIEQSSRLAREMKRLSRLLYRNELLEDIRKYKELWQEAAATKDTGKFIAKVETTNRELQLKYGKEGYRLLEFLIQKILREPESEEGFQHGKLFQSLLKKVCRTAKDSMISYTFPHPKMREHEELLNRWWKFMGSQCNGLVTLKELKRFLESKGVTNDSLTFSTLCKHAGVSLEGPLVLYEDLLALLARPILYSGITNAIALLLQSRTQCSSLSLGLKISRYQRAMYFNSIKNAHVLDREQKETLEAIQQMHRDRSSKPNKTVGGVVDAEEVQSIPIPDAEKEKSSDSEEAKDAVNDDQHTESRSSSESQLSEDEVLNLELRQPRKTLTQELMGAVKNNMSPRSSVVSNPTPVSKGLAVNSRLSLIKLVKM